MTYALFQQTNLPKWEVSLFFQGPIKIEKPINFNTRKDYDREIPLYSNVSIDFNDRHRFDHSYKIKVNTFALKRDIAYKWAFIFVGMSFDVLSFLIDVPLTLTLNNQRVNGEFEYEQSRVVTTEELEFAFKESRLLFLTKPPFLRALSWYRKALLSTDPFDKFLAFWNSIEIVSSNYHTKTEKTKAGSKNQIWQSFNDIWNITTVNTLFSNLDLWLKENYNIRNDIAHGLISIDIDKIEEISSRNVNLQLIAQKFLEDWRNNKLNPESELSEEKRQLLEDKEWFRAE